MLSLSLALSLLCSVKLFQLSQVFKNRQQATTISLRVERKLPEIIPQTLGSVP